ncbi:MAG: hypothetical protein AAGD32_02665 [Planctomycetota bacterium]
MALRPKTIRRGIALLVVLALLVAGGALWYYQNQQKEADRLAQHRTDGMARFDAGDYREAIDLLHPVVGDSGVDDFEAAYAYAISQLRTEPSGSGQLRSVRVRLNEMAELRPDDVDVQRALIEANGRVGLHGDAVDIARRLLETNPNDPEALKALRDNQAANGDTPAALKTARRYNEVVPDDVNGYIATARLMDAAEMGAAEVLTWANELYENDPDNPRYMLVLAVAHNYAKDNDEAMNWLRRAAASPTTDSDLVRLTAGMFDALRLFNESQALLERAAETTDDPKLKAQLAERFWQHDRHDENLRLLADLDLDDPQTDTTLLALRALANLNTGSTASAELEALSLRTEGAARSWHEAITARYDDTVPPHEKITIYDRARQRAPGNVPILAWTGDAYAELGEGELAVRFYEEASERLPSWDEPFLAISRELTATGRLREAMRAARDGLARAHDDTPAWVQIAAVREAIWRKAPQPEAGQRLFELVEAIQQNNPGEPETLPTYLELLVRNGQGEKARDLLLAKVDAGEPLTSDQRLRLARVDAIGGFGMGDALLAASDDPRIVLERALRSRALGDAQAGRHALDELVANNPNDPQAHLALSAYLEADGDPDAATRWKSVAERFADDAEVQRTVLSAASVREDRALVDASIDRLRELTGQAAHQWRLERARFLLESGENTDAMEAAGLLRDLAGDMPYLIAPRVLLARALEQTGKPASAIDYYRAAYDLDPANAAGAGLELVRMLRGQNQLDNARLIAERVADEAALDSQQRLVLAGHLAELGQPDRAIEVLRVAEQLGRLDANGRLVLAELLRRRGADAEADQVLLTLLDNPRPPANAIVAAAINAGASDLAAGRGLLERLNEPHIAELERSLGTAAFEARFGSPDIARALLTAAEQQATTDAEKLRVARQSAALYMSEQAYANARRAAEPFVETDPTLARLSREAALLEQTRSQPDDLAALLAVVEREMGDSDEGAAWTEALTLLRDARDFDNEVTAETLAKLDEVADRYPRLLPLQQWVIRLHLGLGSFDRAADRALKVFDTLPNDARAAELAATTAMRANRFSAARRAGEVWRDRTLEDRVVPDTLIAEAMLREGEPSNAVDLLRPYFDRAQAEPMRFGRTIAIAAEALSTAGRMREARELIDPIAARDMNWRQVALNFAAIAVPQRNDARRWLLDLEAAELPDDLSVAEREADRRAVAFAWWHLAARYPDAELFRDAVSRLEALGTRDVDTLYSLADLHDRYGDQQAAEALYREALTRRPEHAPVLNNLAFLLLQTPGEGTARLLEAQSLADAALASNGDNPAFLDTAARIAAALGDMPLAEERFNAALRADPQNLDALLGLAALKFNNGDRINARRLLSRADAALAQRTQRSELAAHLRRELDELRALRE